MNTDNQHNTFGEFLVAKRRGKEIPSLRVTEALGISPGYYSDIEKNRRNPPPDRDTLAKLAEILQLADEDIATFYDLAGKARSEAPPDLPDYINQHQVVRVALRMAKDSGDARVWGKFIDLLENEREGNNDHAEHRVYTSKNPIHQL